MTELAIHTPNGAAEPALPAQQYLDSPLMKWAMEARQAANVAASLARTSFVPLSMRDKPDDITAAILAGQELGLQPMSTLRSMDVIQGTPALRAHAMRGLVQSHGHEVELIESTENRCVMRGKRRGSSQWQIVEWTIARATRLRLTGKTEWQKQPQTMLVNRATAEICRLIASDVLFAMPYASEELDTAEDDAPPTRVTAAEVLGAPAAIPTAAPSAPAQEPTQAAPAQAEEPPAEAEAPVDEVAEEAQEPAQADARPATNRQLTKLHTLLTTFGVTERADKLQMVGLLIGQRLASSQDLTRTEANTVIDLLERLSQQDDPSRALDLVLAELQQQDGGA